MIVDPIPVPPLSWIDLHALKLHTEMNVIASRQPFLPALAYDLARVLPSRPRARQFR